MKLYYNRYERFTVNGKTKIMPFIKVFPKPSDKVYRYRQGIDRMDKISNLYYGNPQYTWLIMIANPQFGGNEFEIPDGEILRIPFPLRESLQQYINQADREFRLNGDIVNGENI